MAETHQDRVEQLLTAAKDGNGEMLNAILNAVAPDYVHMCAAADAEGATALHLAAKRGYHAVMLQLINAGAAVQAQDQKLDQPLHNAAASGHTSALQLLLDHGADPNAAGSCHRCPLHLAAAAGHVEAVQMLLSHGAGALSTDSDNATPLHAAAEHNHHGAMLLLLQAGAPVDTISKFGTPLHLACMRGSAAAAELLLASGADIAAQEPEDDMAPLHCAAAQSCVECVKMLLAHSTTAHIDARSSTGRTALDVAAHHGHTAAMHALLTAGAAVNTRDEEGNTPLHSAAYGGFHDAVQMLLEAGAAVNTVNSLARTALHLAVAQGHAAVAQGLLAAGADPAAVAHEGSSALTIAARQAARGGKFAVLELLVHHCQGQQCPTHQLVAAGLVAAAATTSDADAQHATVRYLMLAAARQDLDAARVALQALFPCEKAAGCLVATVFMEAWMEASAAATQ